MLQLSVAELLTYALVFLRIGSMMFCLPVFGDNSVPLKAKILVAFSMAMLFTTLLGPEWVMPNSVDPIFIFVLISKEILLGIIIGWCAKLVFDGLVMSASVVGYQMGFGTAGMFNPDMGTTADAFTIMHRMLMMLIFLALNLHHVYVSAILETFRLIPPGGIALPADLGEFMISLAAQLMVTALQLAAPVFVALLFAMSALGLAARTVPQLNVFVVSFPVSFFLGLVIYVATLPLYPGWIDSTIQQNYEQMLSIISSMQAKG